MTPPPPLPQIILDLTSLLWLPMRNVKNEFLLPLTHDLFIGVSVQIANAIILPLQRLSFVCIKLGEHFTLRVVKEKDETGFFLKIGFFRKGLL